VFASVATVDILFTVTLEDALERIKNKNRRPVLRELGPHPETGLPMVICKGRYGPYVTDGKLNGTIGRDTDPEEVSVADAVAMLAAAAVRAAEGGGRPARRGARKVTKKPATKKTARKSTAKKTTAKATGAKKTTAKETTAKKSTAKKTTTKKTSTKKTTTKKTAAKKSTESGTA
jgi:DNA topoisomerase-1